MNDFIEFETVPEKEHFILAEKYRPTKIEDYIGNDQFKNELKRILETGQLPHLMLHGSSPGTGKTSAAKLIVSNIKCDHLYINASDTNSVDDIRLKVKSFASTIGFSDLKVIILDESDFLTPQAQGALRNIIETFSATTRFIFTCNYLEKITSPILSRCQVFEIIPPSKKEIAVHIKNILEKETIKFVPEDLGYIVNTYYPDIRKMLNFAQQSTVNKVLTIYKKDNVVSDLKNKIIELIKKCAFMEIRQLIADNNVRCYEELYQCLYDKVGEYAPKNPAIVILIIAEYMYQSNLVVNKEITFAACIAKIIEELK
jgi:DNA polymerase III delta prime subunit